MKTKIVIASTGEGKGDYNKSVDQKVLKRRIKKAKELLEKKCDINIDSIYYSDVDDKLYSISFKPISNIYKTHSKLKIQTIDFIEQTIIAKALITEKELLSINSK